MTHPDAPQGLEGSLPPCLRVAVFEGWRALFHRDAGCGHDHPKPQLFSINVGAITEWKLSSEDGPLVPWTGIPTHSWNTDDPDEAESLWLEACERLRELP